MLTPEVFYTFTRWRSLLELFHLISALVQGQILTVSVFSLQFDAGFLELLSREQQ